MACAESSWDKHWDDGKRCVAGKWRKSWLRQTSDRNLQKNMNNDTFFPRASAGHGRARRADHLPKLAPSSFNRNRVHIVAHRRTNYK